MKNANSIIALAGRGQTLRLDPAVDSAAVVGGGARDVEDDFFCLRFKVWYPSFDCAIRTRHRTCPGCRDCEQGRFNLKRHASALARLRRPLFHS
jgi:hypothetical protein